jgi:hypothetical protein
LAQRINKVLQSSDSDISQREVQGEVQGEVILPDVGAQLDMKSSDSESVTSISLAVPYAKEALLFDVASHSSHTSSRDSVDSAIDINNF